MIRRRRPILRGAMVGGVGYAAGRAAAKRNVQEESQEQRLSGLEGQQAAATPTAATPTGGMAEQLEQLGKLRDKGVLTPEEFERAKQKVLETGGQEVK
jgi:membrane protease subunit (stomatin/prohibitin family)